MSLLQTFFSTSVLPSRCVLLRAGQNMSGNSSFLPSSPPENKGIVLQIPNRFISKCFNLVDGNKGTLVLLIVRKVVSHLKSTNWTYCTWGIRVCPLCLLQRSEERLAHPRHVISFPLRVPTTLLFLPHLNDSHTKLKNQLRFRLWGDLN